MSELIRQMSEITVPDDLLQQIDVDGLIKNFREKFKRLDDFKKTRDTLANRGRWEKLIKVFDSTLDDAQLDAVEIQAAFSKAIGQLMILSVVQSQRLQQQQDQLLKQQERIKDLTQSIERHAEELNERNEILARQNAGLDGLIDECVELKGLTLERAERLLDFMHEIHAIRDALNERWVASNEAVERITVRIEQQEQKLEGRSSAMSSRLEVITNEFSAYRARMQATLSRLYAGLAVSAVGVIGAIAYVTTRL